jgi:hypothetical protein
MFFEGLFPEKIAFSAHISKKLNLIDQVVQAGADLKMHDMDCLAISRP